MGLYTRLIQDIGNETWSKQLLRDLAEWKLCGKLNKTESPSEKLDVDLLLAAAHIVCPAWGKQQEVPRTTLDLFEVMAVALERQEKSTNASGQKKDAGDKENEPEDDADPSAGSAPAPKPPLERAKSKMEDGSSRVINISQVATFPVGSQVRTKAAKSKKEYDGHRGEIQALMNKKAKVLLMEGPKKGSTL